MTPAYSLIRQAVLNKQQVVAWYNGHRREMCPHVLGTSKDGREQALFYQFGGTSQRGLGPDGSDENWRCLPLEGLSDVFVREGPWHTERSPYSSQYDSRKQDCVASVDVEVRM